jgi:6-phosphofructokinase 1
LSELGYDLHEDNFKLDGENGFLSALRERIQKRAHAVVAVAEGAGQEFFEDPSTELLRC